MTPDLPPALLDLISAPDLKCRKQGAELAASLGLTHPLIVFSTRVKFAAWSEPTGARYYPRCMEPATRSETHGLTRLEALTKLYRSMTKRPWVLSASVRGCRRICRRYSSEAGAGDALTALMAHPGKWSFWEIGYCEGGESLYPSPDEITAVVQHWEELGGWR